MPVAVSRNIGVNTCRCRSQPGKAHPGRSSQDAPRYVAVPWPAMFNAAGYRRLGGTVQRARIAATTFPYAGVSFPSLAAPGLLRKPSSPRLLRKSAHDSHLLMARTAPRSNGGGEIFSPRAYHPRANVRELRFAHSSRGKKVTPPPTSTVVRPTSRVRRRSSSCFGIEAAMVAGSNSKEN